MSAENFLLTPVAESASNTHMITTAAEEAPVMTTTAVNRLIVAGQFKNRRRTRAALADHYGVSYWAIKFRDCPDSEADSDLARSGMRAGIVTRCCLPLTWATLPIEVRDEVTK